MRRREGGREGDEGGREGDEGGREMREGGEDEGREGEMREGGEEKEGGEMREGGTTDSLFCHLMSPSLTDSANGGDLTVLSSSPRAKGERVP